VHQQQCIEAFELHPQFFQLVLRLSKGSA
jgi:hypothetical protein